MARLGAISGRQQVAALPLGQRWLIMAALRSRLAETATL